MLFKETSSSALTNSNKPTPLSADSNYRSVSLKKTQSTAKSNTASVKIASKPSTTKNVAPIQSKVAPLTNNKVKVPVIQVSQVRSIAKNEKTVNVKIANGQKQKVVEKEASKPILVRTPLVRKRPSTELLKPIVVDNSDSHDNESISSESGSDEPVDDITRKMGKCIFCKFISIIIKESCPHNYAMVDIYLKTVKSSS